MTKGFAFATLLLIGTTAMASPTLDARSGYISSTQEETLSVFLDHVRTLDLLEPSNSTVCWKSSYGRGVGTPINTCDEGLEQSGLLCYPPCRDGFYGVGPVCWEYCKDGFTDEGALCGKGGSIISSDHGSCPWYDVCGLTFAKGCSHCPDGYHNDGCTCRIDPQVYAKKSYGRGVGVPLGCGSKEYDAGLCYDRCNDGYDHVGPVCWHQCPASHPVSGGALCCDSDSDCTSKVVELARGVLTAAAAAIAAAEDPDDILKALKAIVEAGLGFALPLCTE